MVIRGIQKRVLIVCILTILAIITVFLVLRVFATDITNSLEPRYILCIPQGGIIDMCNAILRCHKYAVSTNRILLIDTTTGWFNDDINEYIQIHSPYVYTGHPATLYEKIKDKSIYPKGINLMDIKAPVNRDNKFYMDDTLVTYDLNREFNETVLVYSMFRLGEPGFTELLQFCSFSKIVVDAYKKTRARLPKSYVSVHIRNTDYESNVAEFMEKHSSELENKAIFLASDNKQTIDQFKERYGANLYSFAFIPDNGGKPIHENYVRTKEESKKYNTETLVDILLLAAADEYYYSNAQSGFSKTVTELRNDKRLLDRLIE